MREQIPASCYLQMLTKHPVRHPLTPDCLVRCLKLRLLPSTYEALARAVGSDAAIRDLIEVNERSGLMGVFNIGSARSSEIRRCLAAIGLTEPKLTIEPPELLPCTPPAAPTLF
jgi:hypothetical protein